MRDLVLSTRGALLRAAAVSAAFALGITGAIVLAEPASADPIERLVASGGTDEGDCSSAACATISYAVSQSVAGDTISVGAGTFPADIAIGIDLTVVGTVVGGVNQTLIHTTAGDTVTVTGAADVTLQSLNISGDAAASDLGDWEWAVTNNGTGTLTIADSSVRDLDVQVVQNNSTGTLVITGSSIGNSGGNSGVSNTSSGRVEIRDSLISDNNGYGVLVDSSGATGPIVIESTTISGNAQAGVLNTSSADIQITDSSIVGNGDLSPNTYPGVRNTGDGTITIVRSTVSGNEGGAIVNGYSDGSASGKVIVVSSTLDGSDQPGIYTYGPASSTLIGSTVYSEFGAVGSWAAGGSDATVTMGGTFAFNESVNPDACVGDSDFVDLGYNVAYTDPAWGELFCDFTESTSVETSPTEIGPLQDNGGPTETRAPGADAPTLGTIPAGTTVTAGGVDYALCADTDQRGVPRPQGTNCEPGAVELVPSSVVVSASPEPSEAGENFTLTGTVSPGIASLSVPTGTVAFYPEGSTTPIIGCESVALSAGQADCTTSVSTPGTVGYVASYSGLSGYLDSESEPYEHDVSKQLITVTASNETMTYGGTVPTVTASYAGFEGTDDEDDIDTPASCSANVSAGTTSCSGAADDVYDFVYVTGTLTIDPADLTVTASNEVMTYGGTAPVPSPIYSGFVNGDDADDLDAVPGCLAVPSGPYTFCVGGSDPNYTFHYVQGALFVNPATLTVTASDETMTYGGAEPTPTPSYSGFVNGENDSVVSVDSTCTVDVAARTTSCTGGDAGPHYQLVYVSGELTVDKVTLTVTASDASMVYGEALPTVAPNYSGFVPGDDAGDLDTAPTCTADPATLTTVCSGGVSANYSFNYVPGTLLVTPATLVVDTTALPEATKGESYSAQLVAHGGLGGPYVWTLEPSSSLPAGLSLAADGTVSGIPSQTGDFSFVVLLDGQVPATVTLSVAAAGLAFTGADVLPLGLAGLLALLLGLGAFGVAFRRRRG